MTRKLFPLPQYNPAPDEYIIVVFSKPDKKNEQRFDMYWHVKNRLHDYTGKPFTTDYPDTTGGTRGQCFRGELQSHIDRAKKKNKKVTIIEKYGER